MIKYSNVQEGSYRKGINILLLIVLFFTLIYSSQLREGTLGHRYGHLNYIYVAVLVLLLVIYRSSFSRWPFLGAVIANGYILMSSMYYQGNYQSIILCMISFGAPLFLSALKLKGMQFSKFLRTLLYILNVLIIFITIIGIADYFMAHKIIAVIGRYMTESAQNMIEASNMDTVYRMYSIMGHPLFNAELYLMFYSLNILSGMYCERVMNKYVVIVITVIGISLTASKTAIILLIAAIIFLNGQKLKARNYILLSVGFLFLYRIGLFDSTIQRFTEGSLTSGRAETWQIVSSLNLFPIRFFTGYGLGFAFNYNDIVAHASSAFEYPIRMFSLEEGIVTTILIYVCIGAYPTYILLKRKHFNLIMGFLLVFIDVNTFNGLAIDGDYMLVLCIFIFTILNLSDYILNDERLKLK